VLEKLGFVSDGDSMLFVRPGNGAFLHVNTVLTRKKFEPTSAE